MRTLSTSQCGLSESAGSLFTFEQLAAISARYACFEGHHHECQPSPDRHPSASTSDQKAEQAARADCRSTGRRPRRARSTGAANLFSIPLAEREAAANGGLARRGQILNPQFFHAVAPWPEREKSVDSRPDPMTLAIETAGLTKHYGQASGSIASLRARLGMPPHATVRALESLDIAVREGEVFGFLGPNGAGKSTTIRLLLGFLHPTAGSARVLGLDTVRDSVAIRRRLGYLPSGIALYDTLTGEQLLDYLAALSGRPPVRRRQLCDRLELSAATLKRLVRDYSRGLRQKIGIIPALQHDPELAILDEPTEGLDPLMQRAFYEILDVLKAEGRTIFFSSHVLSEVERVCDRVAIVRQGRLVALEETAGLLARRKRNIMLRFTGRAPALETVAGITNVEHGDGSLTCRRRGRAAVPRGDRRYGGCRSDD